MGKLKIGCLVVVGFFLLIGVIGAIGGGNKSEKNNNSQSSSVSSSQPQAKQEQKATPKEYTEISVSTLMQDLQDNAMAAQKKYKDKNLKVTGQVEVMDSSGNYISLHGDSYSIVGVQCMINKKDKAQEDFLLNIKKGQTITAYGTITDVGEVMGYSLKVDKFE